MSSVWVVTWPRKTGSSLNMDSSQTWDILLQRRFEETLTLFQHKGKVNRLPGFILCLLQRLIKVFCSYFCQRQHFWNCQKTKKTNQTDNLEAGLSGGVKWRLSLGTQTHTAQFVVVLNATCWFTTKGTECFTVWELLNSVFYFYFKWDYLQTCAFVLSLEKKLSHALYFSLLPDNTEDLVLCASEWFTWARLLYTRRQTFASWRCYLDSHLL